jgi:hypothetical protein
MQDKILTQAQLTKSFANMAKLRCRECQYHRKLTSTRNSGLIAPEDMTKEILPVVTIIFQVMATDVTEIAYALLSVPWAFIWYKPYGTQGSHTLLNGNPWLTFNVCALSATVTLLSAENLGSGFSQFHIPV